MSKSRYTPPADKPLRDAIKWLRASLLDEAIDHHNYRRDTRGKDAGTQCHPGAFGDCPTMRCERIRVCLASTEAP